MNGRQLSLIQAITHLASRLSDEFEVREVRFRLSAAGASCTFDLIWSGAGDEHDGDELGAETDEDRGREQSLTVRDVVDRHDGEMWLEREKVRHRAFFRILPAATPQEQAEADLPARQSRPEQPAYDLDLPRGRRNGHRSRRPPAPI